MEIGAVGVLLGLLVGITEDLVQIVKSIGIYISVKVSFRLQRHKVIAHRARLARETSKAVMSCIGNLCALITFMTCSWKISKSLMLSGMPLTL